MPASSLSDDDRVKLLFGPYKAPAVQVGDRAECLYRAVVVYGWSSVRIPWPLCPRRDAPSARGCWSRRGWHVPSARSPPESIL
jgi:hypothetical protein